MEQAKPTPGPWRWVRHGDGEILQSEAEGRPNVLSAEAGPLGEPFVNVSEMDQRLIAAAPKLLAALKRAANAIAYASNHVPRTGDEQMTVAWATAQGAIAEAEQSPGGDP